MDQFFPASFSQSKNYLLCNLVLYLFRCFMYTIQFDRVSREKVKPEKWENADVRAAIYKYSSAVYQYMWVKCIIYGWGAYLNDPTARNQLAYICLGLESLVLLLLLREDFITTSQSEISARPIIPRILQSLTVANGIYMCTAWK